MHLGNVSNYASNVPDEVIDQLNNFISLNCVTRAALMPDAHLGYTVPIGTVLEMRAFVSPSVVG